MSLRFMIGGSGSGKSTALQEEIIRRAEKEPGRQFIIVVPDQFTMQTQKEIVERTPRKGIMNIDVQSFGRLCHRLADEVGETERIVLDDTGKNLLLRRIAGQLAEELPTIGSSLKRSGYIHEVKSVISEFMQYGLGVEEVQRLIDYAQGKKLLQAKLKDINKIYASFQEWLGQDYIAKEERMDILAGDILRSEKMKGSVVAFDGFTGFTPVQDNVITQLMSVCSEVIVTVIMPPTELESYRRHPEEHRLFALSDKTMRSMEQLAQNAGCARGEDLFMPEGTVYRYKGRPVLDFWNRICSAAGSVFTPVRPPENCRVLRQRIRRRNCGRSSAGYGSLPGKGEWPIGILPWSAETWSVMHRMRNSWRHSMRSPFSWTTTRSWSRIRLLNSCAALLRSQRGISLMRA